MSSDLTVSVLIPVYNERHTIERVISRVREVGVKTQIVLVDEVLTPDSSRFWPADSYEPGRAQVSFDKQPLRDYLDGERRAGRWNGDAPPPALPPEVISATSRRYMEAYERITGTPLGLETHRL